MNFTQTSVHKKIQDHVSEIPHLRVLAEDKARTESLKLSSRLMRVDFTRQHVDETILNYLCSILDEMNFRESQASFFAGAKINISEKRAVLHMALRAQKGEDYKIDGQSIMHDVDTMRDAMYHHARTIRCNKDIKNVIVIGIGGSDLGPRFVVNAFQDILDGPKVYFVSNVDEHDLLRVLKKCEVHDTIFLIASKTFTTAETMLNAKTALAWSQNKIDQFYAITTSAVKATEWGIQGDRILAFPEWVGGRFSIWSTIGFPVAIAFGTDAFDELLKGANQCDHDFLNKDYKQNIPVLMALFALYNRNYLKLPTHLIAPYDARLRLISKYVQQMDMESNGKNIDRDGKRVTYETAPQVYGEVGTDCQHSYFQMAHQGTDLVPVDLIGVTQHDNPEYADHHKMLIANMKAQADALAYGQTLEEANQDPFRVCDGNRPNSILTLNEFRFESLGYLMACYEHKTFTQGVLWNLNSFDQPGVELGKSIALKKLKSNG